MPAVPKPIYKKTKPPFHWEKQQVEPVETAIPKPPQFNKEESEENARAAVERDGGICQWHRLVYNETVPAATPHHIHGRRRDWSERGQICLCMDCHTAYHTAKMVDGKIEITVEDLDNLIKVIYGEMTAEQWVEAYFKEEEGA